MSWTIEKITNNSIEKRNLMINGFTKNHAIGATLGLGAGMSAGALLGTVMVAEAVTSPITWPTVGILAGIIDKQDEGVKAQAKQAFESAAFLGVAQFVVSPLVLLAAPIVATGVTVAGGISGFCMAETKEVTEYYKL